MLKRMIELLNEANKKEFYIDRRAAYLLEKDVFAPPCKVGATVFGIHTVFSPEKGFEKKSVFRGNIKSFFINKDGVFMSVYYDVGMSVQYKITDFGKVVFATEEAAEKALKEGL